MRDVQGLANVFFLLMLAEEKHVHKIGVDHIQIPNVREKSLVEDVVKDVQIGRHLIGYLLCLGLNLLRAVGPESLLVSGGYVAVRAKADRRRKSVIFHPK